MHRLGVYPTWILYSTTIEAPQIVEMFPAYYFFNGLLSVLLVLHVIWTYFILKIVYKAMYSGKVLYSVLTFNIELRKFEVLTSLSQTEKDSRSESSDLTISSSSSEEVGGDRSRTKKQDWWDINIYTVTKCQHVKKATRDFPFYSQRYCTRTRWFEKRNQHHTSFCDFVRKELKLSVVNARIHAITFPQERKCSKKVFN